MGHVTNGARSRPLATVLFAGGAVSFLVAGLLAGTASAGNNGKGNAPPGSNGTIKINDIALDKGKANQPHISCPFDVSFWGFDEGTDSATVTFTAQPPSKTTHGSDPQVVNPTTGESTFEFTASGGEQDRNHAETYVLDTTGLYQHPKQGFHIKVTVSVTANEPAPAPGKGKGNGPKKATTKYKVFWYEPCETTSPTPTPTPTKTHKPTPTPTPSVQPTTAVKGVKHTRPLTEVKGEKVVKQLPFTGTRAPVGFLTALALGLILTGSGVMTVARRPAGRHG